MVESIKNSKIKDLKVIFLKRMLFWQSQIKDNTKNFIILKNIFIKNYIIWIFVYILLQH